jgi:predicted GH43/DUF377 family glycosyl hydrolase
VTGPGPGTFALKTPHFSTEAGCPCKYEAKPIPAPAASNSRRDSLYAMVSKLHYLTALCMLTLRADPVLFAYFYEPAKSGIHFATSEDGYHFKPLKKEAWLPTQFPDELTRDPFITRGPDGEFHMVWTWGWREQHIGYAHSKDLIHWSEQRKCLLFPEAKNTWAPEIYWDERVKSWLIVFSSVVEGKNATNRLYKSYTKDFASFTKPEIFFDPGYEVIDATLMKSKGKYWMIFKDERPEPLHKEIKIAEGPTWTGPWTNISEALTVSWSEGPSILELAGEYVIYYDHYRDPKRFEAIASKDLKNWKLILDRISLPESSKHGSFLRITPEEAKRLLQAANQ